MKNLITKDSVDVATLTEGTPTNIADIVASFKRSVGDLSLYDDVVFEADVEQQGARAKTHLRLRAYRRSGG